MMTQSDNSRSAAVSGSETEAITGEDDEGSSSGPGVITGPGNSLPEQINGENVAAQRGGLLARLMASIKRTNRGSIREDLSDALAQHDIHDSDLTPEERVMLNNILRLQDVRAEDLMVARAEIVAADIRTTLGELLVQFESSGHSRMPVYDDTLDDPRGMIHIRDLLGYITKAAAGKRRNGKSAAGKLDLTKVDLEKELGKANLVRTVLFVPPSMMAADLMARMQANRIQMALVIDEYGGTEGLISLEDIVEIIVGDIEDEHDDEDELIRTGENGAMILDAKAEIEDIREMLGGKFNVEDHDEDAETIGGVIFSLLGRVPVKGELIDAFGYEFRIRDADPRRIRSIEMVRSKKTAARKAKAG